MQESLPQISKRPSLLTQLWNWYYAQPKIKVKTILSVWSFLPGLHREIKTFLGRISEMYIYLLLWNFFFDIMATTYYNTTKHLPPPQGWYVYPFSYRVSQHKQPLVPQIVVLKVVYFETPCICFMILFSINILV